MSTTLLTLVQRLSENIGDWLEVDTTTNITTNTSIVSTALNAYDNGVDDFFNNWWVYITEGNNITVERQISDYATSTGTLTVRGANLSAESGAVTIDLSRYPHSDKVKALNRGIEEVYPSIKRNIDDKTLIAGNWLPNSHFEDWASSSYPDKYGVTNCTAAATTTSGLHRGGVSSCKVTASAADGYMYISSNDYPKLLDLAGLTVDFSSWAYPEVADDAFLTIYTQKADGTEQTLNSTTTCPATKWSQLKLDSQAINDDIQLIQIRFRVHTNAKYTYFDDARVTTSDGCEIRLPTSLRKGTVSRVFIQNTGDADDEINPSSYTEYFGWDVIEDDTDKYLSIPFTSSQRIRIFGDSPLESLSSVTDTISLDAGGTLDSLVAYASYWLFKMVARPSTGAGKDKILQDEADAYSEYQRLIRKHRSPYKAGRMNV